MPPRSASREMIVRRPPSSETEIAISDRDLGLQL